MLARNETLFKWLLYTLGALLWVLVQTALLQRVTLWGVIPFCYPLIAAIPATYEGPSAAMVFALCVGVFCDLLLPAPLPCFYTLIFPAVGLCACLIARNLLPAGFLCSLAASAAAFFLTDLFQCLLLWGRGKAAWGAGAWVLCREFLLTAPLIIPMTLLFRGVYRRTHADD